MGTSKNIDKICIAAVAITLVITILFMCGGSLGVVALERTVKYESTLFDTSYVHKIDIVMNDWDSFIENCESEEYYVCTVVVDGNKHSNIAIRAKGNTSLSNVKSMNSQRYSFKLEFDHYEDGKNLDGLDKLCLNNLIQDNTMMKDYLVYRMMYDFGVDSPLCSFAYLTVNGEDWGLYLAVEGIEDGFLYRNYGSDTGELYKPDSLSFGGGRGNGKDFNMENFDFDDFDWGDFNTEDFDAGNFGNFGSSDKPNTDNSQSATTGSMKSNNQQMSFTQGGNVPSMPTDGSMPSMPTDGNVPSMPTDDTQPVTSQESDTATDTDENITSSENPVTEKSEATQPTEGTVPTKPTDGNAKMGGGMGGFGMGSDDVKLKYIDDDPDSYSNIFNNAKTDVSNADKKRLIASLKNLSSYTDLENTVDTEEVIRYFVVHNFVCNGDSYTGSMIHNYYLHESDGKLSMIPWDYNLAYGTFQGGNASDSVNASIDNPISGGDVDDRPMLGWIFSDETYTNEYHEIFAEFVDEYITGGKLEAMINITAEMIRPYVEKDPTKFCTIEEFDDGIAAMSEFVSLRGEAVTRQLAGDDTAVETGDLNLSDMGSMGGSMGGDKGDFGGADMSNIPQMGDFSQFGGGRGRRGESTDGESAQSDGNASTAAKGSFTMPTNGSMLSMPSDGSFTTPNDGSMPSMPSDGSFTMPNDGSMPSMPSDGSFTMPNDGSMPSMPSDGSFTMPNDSSMPSMPSDGSFTTPNDGSMPSMPSDGSFTTPNDGSQSEDGSSRRSFSSNFNPLSGGQETGNSDTEKWILTGISAVVLAIGIIIVVKKKY